MTRRITRESSLRAMVDNGVGARMSQYMNSPLGKLKRSLGARSAVEAAASENLGRRMEDWESDFVVRDYLRTLMGLPVESDEQSENLKKARSVDMECDAFRGLVDRVLNSRVEHPLDETTVSQGLLAWANEGLK